MLTLYTFKCQDCDQSFEARRAMSDDRMPPCPRCETNQHVIKPIVSTPAIVMNWYRSESVHESVRYRSPVSR